MALSYADKVPGTEVVVLSMTPGSAAATVRKGLAMGATSAVQIVDDALVGADLGLTAEVLAAAVKRTGFDLVIAGNLSTDGSGGVVPAMIAELLAVPAVTSLNAVDISETEVSGDRSSEGATHPRDGAAARGHLDHRALPGRAVPQLQGHHGGEEEAVRDPVARRSRRSTRRIRRRRGRS